MQYIAKIFLSLVVFLVFFLGWEGIQRIRHPNANRAFHSSLNTMGYRGQEVSVKKAPGSQRLLFIGGSTTFGIWNQTDETFPSLTGAILQKKMPETPIEIINAGRCGATSSGEMAQLRKMIRLQPDIVVVMTGYNDSATVYGDYVQIDQRGNLELLPWYLVVDGFFLSHSVAYVVLREKIAKVLHGDPVAAFHYKTNPAEASTVPFRVPGHVAREKSWFKRYRKIFARNVRQMFLISSQHHAKIIFVKAPLSPQRSQELPLYAKAYHSLMRVLETFCARNGLPLVVCEDTSWNTEPGRFFQADGLHFTKEGNFLLASQLCDYLFRKKELYFHSDH